MAKNKKNVNKYREEEQEIRIKLRRLDLEEKIHDIELEKKQNYDEEQQTLLGKINTLGWILQSVTVDDDKNHLGGDPVLRRVFAEEESYEIKAKLRDLIKQL